MNRRLLLATCASLALSCTAAWGQATVQLLDAGAAPRAPLRYRFEAGRQERAVVEFSFDNASFVDGKPASPSLATPPLRMEMKLHIASVDANGLARVEFMVDSADAVGNPPTPARKDSDSENGWFAAKMYLLKAKGLAGGYPLDARGHAELAAPPPLLGPDGGLIRFGADAGGVAQMLAGAMVPFPVEAVGQGARWQVAGANVAGVDQPASGMVYTLRSRNGNRIIVELSAAATTRDAPGAPPHEMKVGSMVVRTKTEFSILDGNGTALVDLDRLVPTMSWRDSLSHQGTSAADKGPVRKTSGSAHTQLSVAPAGE